MVKTKHYHRRRVRYPARAFGSAGYVTLVIAWLLVIGLLGVYVIGWLLGLLPQDDTVSSLETALSYGSTSGVATPETPLLTRIVLVLLLVAIIVALAHFVADRTSRLLRYFLNAIGAKITLGLLFGVKCVLALMAVMAQLVVVLGMPSTEIYPYFFVGVTGILSLISVISFSVQHFIARRAHVAVKNVL